MEKAPDKIYCGNNGHGNLSYSTERVYPSMEEYIRKDALVEWAKEQASSTEKLNGRGAMLKAWDSLINKIESL